MPNAGGLRDRCTFQAESHEADAGGGGASSWATQITVWGRLTMREGTERLDAGRLADSATGVLIVRYSTETKNVLPQWRVLIDDVPYAIDGPPQDRQRMKKWFEIPVRRGGAI